VFAYLCVVCRFCRLFSLPGVVFRFCVCLHLYAAFRVFWRNYGGKDSISFNIFSGKMNRGLQRCGGSQFHKISYFGGGNEQRFTFAPFLCNCLACKGVSYFLGAVKFNKFKYFSGKMSGVSFAWRCLCNCMACNALRNYRCGCTANGAFLVDQ